MDKIGNHITWLIHSLFAAWRYMDLSCIPLPAAGMPMKRAMNRLMFLGYFSASKLFQPLKMNFHFTLGENMTIFVHALC